MNRRLAAATAIIAALGAATACKPTSTTGSNGSIATPASNASTGNTTAATKTVPAFTGMGLQSAQDAAQAAGFYSLDSHDSLGRDRMQILDRDWKVCSQNVKAGTKVATDTKLDFGAVKLKETCPAHDQAAPTAVGGAMPNFKGKSVKAARAALDGGTSINVNDASGDGRFILVESNWQVCTQTPAAGEKLNGQPVQLTAVKYGESCP
ncbi:PASTA domain-containing protein [Streptomyces sp. NPDC005799]|uniref:PASTA domain-containing protein n=1 Tax=Streptomyces sp. NPDC005799 TaxID=3154678 RepID=UPI0033CAFE5E